MLLSPQPPPAGGLHFPESPRLAQLSHLVGGMSSRHLYVETSQAVDTLQFSSDFASRKGL